MSETRSSSVEEGDVIDYDEFVPDVFADKLPPKTKEYYFQEYPYVVPTQDDADRKELDQSKLFDKTKVVKYENSVVIDQEPIREASILVTGFGMRNVDSFQRRIKMSHEEREKWDLRKLWREEHGKLFSGVRQTRQEAPSDRDVITASSSTTIKSSSTDFLTQTEEIKSKGIRGDMQGLDYLLGLETQAEEAVHSDLAEEEEECEDDFKYSSSKATREAQRYLRVHRIFEVFQFIVSHLLSAKAENPIEFILNLLNRCILYRSGLGEPPLLYERKHINQLFDLMDRMQTGYIEMEQYISGLNTLGICSYNEEPSTNEEGMVSRESFVEEAYEAELAIFDDLIKRRTEKLAPKERRAPKALTSGSLTSTKKPYFIPSDLFKYRKPVSLTSYVPEPYGEYFG